MAKKKTPPRNSKGKFIKQGNLVSDDIFLPNHSGEHTAGTTATPINDDQLANKSYVDSQNFWKRVGTMLSPKTAGDDLDMGTGTIQSGDVTIGDHTSAMTVNILGAINNANAGRINLYEGANSGGFIKYNGNTNFMQVGVAGIHGEKIGIEFARETAAGRIPNSPRFIFGETVLQQVWVYGETGTTNGAKLMIVDDDTDHDGTGNPIGGILHYNGATDDLIIETSDGTDTYTHMTFPRDSNDTIVKENLNVTNKIASGTSTFSTVGPTDNVDVSGVNTLFIDATSNAVTIGGFSGGVAGQKLMVVRCCATANNVTLEHNEGGGSQDIFLHKGADETLFTEYGGWNLVCDGTDWYDCSHAKHI